MNTKTKILIGILVVLILAAGGWWLRIELKKNIPGPGDICGPGGMGPKYDVSYCNKSCEVDNDCEFTCGCGAINKNEICHDEEIVYDCVDHEVKCKKGKCVEEKEIISEEVTIATDKTGYKRGEAVKITVKNGLDKSIWYSPGCNSGFASLYRLKDNDWQEIYFSFPTFHRDAEYQDIGADYTGYWICGLIACEQVSLIELKPNSEINQQIKSICEWPIHSIGVPETEPKIIEGGTYRLSFSYGLNREGVDLAELIYSDEFTIE